MKPENQANIDNNNNVRSPTISSETVKRLLKDVKYIIKNPLTDNNIYYSHDESNMLVGYAMIVGPSDTPYFGGFYFFQFDYPVDYPYSPPKVTYMTNDGYTRYNPNLYKCGKVCVSLLNTWAGEKWTSCQTLNSVLITLCSLLNEHPLLNEPGQNNFSRDFKPYNRFIEYKNIDFCYCDMIDKRKNKIPEQFIQFYSFMVENFLRCYDKILNFVLSKKDVITVEAVHIYSMHLQIDYNMLLEKLKNTKIYVDSINTKITEDLVK